MIIRPIVIKNISNNRGLQIFLFGVLAYLLPLGCIFLMNNTALGQIDIANFILFGIEAASPTIAAILIVLFFEKKSGIKKFFCSNFSPKLKISSALGCVIIAIAIMFTAKAILYLLLKVPFEMAELTSKQFIIIVWAFIAEEIGWRGFLTKKLSVSLNKKLVPLLVGMIWAFWHYHFFVIGTIDVVFPLFIVGCVVDSYLYAIFLIVSKGNILIAMIFHMSSNFFLNLFLINPNVNGGSSIPYATYVVVSAIYVIGITMTLTSENEKISTLHSSPYW